MTDRTQLRACVALAAYAESLAVGRRVLVVGDAAAGLAERLLDRGARLVQVVDPDPARAATIRTEGVPRRVVVTALEDAENGGLQGGFDLAVVPNLAHVPDVPARLRWIARQLAPRGVVLAATPNPDVKFRMLPEPGTRGELLDYTAFWDVMAERFEGVRMLGQAPFVGYALVDFGMQAEEPEPAFDAGFLPGGAEEPDFFVAVAGADPADLEPYLVVQLPFRAVVLPRREAAGRESRSREAELAREVARLEAWARTLEERAETADQRADAAELELERARAGDATPAEEVAGLRRENEALQAELTTLRQALAAAEERAAEARRAEARHREAAAAAEQQAALARTAEREQRDAVVELRAAAARLEEALAEARAAASVDTPDDGMAARELAELEERLRERAAVVARLERDLAEARGAGQALLLELQDMKSRDTERVTVELRQRLEHLARVNAQLTAELAGARWREEALQARVADAPIAERPKLTD